MSVDYSEISKSYDEYRSYNDEIIKEIAETACISRGMSVLDLGGGTGNISLKLTKSTQSHPICLDISPGMLRKAKEKSITVICADANGAFPLKSNSFDVIISAYVIHQIKKVGDFLWECGRVLKNGTLVILTSSHYQIEHFHPVPRSFFPSGVDIEKKRFPAIEQIIDFMMSVGFSNIRCSDVLIEKNEINEEYLHRVRNKFVSTYHLIPEYEFNKGIDKIESSLRSSHQMNFLEWRGTIISGKKIL